MSLLCQFRGVSQHKDCHEQAGDILSFPARIAFGHKVRLQESAERQDLSNTTPKAIRAACGVFAVVAFPVTLMGLGLTYSSSTHRAKRSMQINCMLRESRWGRESLSFPVRMKTAILAGDMKELEACKQIAEVNKYNYKYNSAYIRIEDADSGRKVSLLTLTVMAGKYRVFKFLQSFPALGVVGEPLPLEKPTPLFVACQRSPDDFDSLETMISDLLDLYDPTETYKGRSILDCALENHFPNRVCNLIESAMAVQSLRDAVTNLDADELLKVCQTLKQRPTLILRVNVAHLMVVSKKVNEPRKGLLEYLIEHNRHDLLKMLLEVPGVSVESQILISQQLYFRGRVREILIYRGRYQGDSFYVPLLQVVCAMGRGHERMAETIVEAGALVVYGEDDQLLLDIARDGGCSAEWCELLSNRISFNKLERLNDTQKGHSLFQVIIDKKLGGLNHFLKQGASPNMFLYAKDKYLPCYHPHSTPLAFVVEAFSRAPHSEKTYWMAVLCTLLQAGADPEIVAGRASGDCFFVTGEPRPLVTACVKGCSQIVDLLVRHGADPITPDKTGKMPCMLYEDNDTTKRMLNDYSERFLMERRLREDVAIVCPVEDRKHLACFGFHNIVMPDSSLKEMCNLFQVAWQTFDTDDRLVSREHKELLLAAMKAFPSYCSACKPIDDLSNNCLVLERHLGGLFVIPCLFDEEDEEGLSTKYASTVVCYRNFVIHGDLGSSRPGLTVYNLSSLVRGVMGNISYAAILKELKKPDSRWLTQIAHVSIPAQNTGECTWENTILNSIESMLLALMMVENGTEDIQGLDKEHAFPIIHSFRVHAIIDAAAKYLDFHAAFPNTGLHSSRLLRDIVKQLFEMYHSDSIGQSDKDKILVIMKRIRESCLCIEGFIGDAFCGEEDIQIPECQFNVPQTVCSANIFKYHRAELRA